MSFLSGKSSPDQSEKNHFAHRKITSVILCAVMMMTGFTAAGVLTGCSQNETNQENFQPTEKTETFSFSDGTLTIHSDKFFDSDYTQFQDNESVKAINIKEEMTAITDEAFKGITGVSRITIPENVEMVGSGVFSGWKSSQTIYIKGGFAAPDNWDPDWDADCNARILFSFGDEDGTNGNNSVTHSFENGVLTIQSDRYYDKDASKYKGNADVKSVIVEDGVSMIDNAAFKACENLESVTISDTVRTIGKNSFGRCSKLNHVVLPDGLRSIAKYAFEDCTSLTDITIPDSVTSIGMDAFNRTPWLTDNKQELLIVGQGILLRYNGSAQNVTVPDNVIRIGHNAFKNCQSVTDITLPAGLKSIGLSAFYNCSHLTKITVPENIKSLAKNTFNRCLSLTSVTLPDGMKNIGESAFANCAKLTDMVLPDSTLSIGKAAFEDCTSLRSVTIPQNVKTIGSDAFLYCENLTEINADQNNKNFTSIDGVLYNKACTKLKCCPAGKSSITIPESVINIGDHALYRCCRITSLTLPDGLNHIGEYAFYDCSVLTSITVPQTVENLGDDAFYGWESDQTIYFKDRSAPSDNWDPKWNENCNAEIIWAA